MSIQMIEWLWGSPLRASEVLSWRPSLDDGGCPRDWRWWGVAWPRMRTLHGTTMPIWNFVWLWTRVTGRDWS